MKKITIVSGCGTALAAFLTFAGMGLAASLDSKFAMMAAHGGVAEVEMGKLAAEKGSDADVKAFGQQMVDDHSKANDQLKSVAQSESMDLPTSMNAKQMATFTKLKMLSGSTFDKAYVNAMVMDHKEDIAAFEKEASAGADPKIKDFASQTLPTLKEHRTKIMALQTKLGK